MYWLNIIDLLIEYLEVRIYKKTKKTCLWNYEFDEIEYKSALRRWNSCSGIKAWTRSAKEEFKAASKEFS